MPVGIGYSSDNIVVFRSHHPYCRPKSLIGSGDCRIGSEGLVVEVGPHVDQTEDVGGVCDIHYAEVEGQSVFQKLLEPVEVRQVPVNVRESHRRYPYHVADTYPR